MAELSTYSTALDLIGEVKPKPVAAAGEPGAIPAMARIDNPADIPAAQMQAFETRKRDKQREEKFVAENRDPGVELDVESGLGAGTRAKMSFERDSKKRMEWLASQDGIEAVRPTKSGDGIIARIKTDDGGMRDVLLDERKMTMGDFADMTGDLPQVATQALVAYFTGGSSLITQAVAGGLAGAIEGGAQDAAVRAGSGRDIDPGEIAKSRGAQAAFDTALPLIPAGAKRLAQAAVGPFSSSVGKLEREAARIGKERGIPMSAAQLTGNKAVARVETFTKELPFGTPLVEQAKAQDDAINKVREYLLDGPADQVPSGQEIADRVSGVLAVEKEGAERNIQSKAMAGEANAQKSIDDLLEQNIPGGAVSPSQAGSAARSKIIAQRDAFKAKANDAYGKAYSMEGADTEFVPSTPIIELVDEIKGKSIEATQRLLPEINRIFGVGNSLVKTEKLSPILDQFGKSMGAAEISIPQKMTLRQAVELRSVIGDMVGRPEALPGIPTGYIKRLYGAASEAIDKGVKEAPNPEIAKALGEAQAYYKDNFWKFEQPGVAELFGETAPGKGYKVGDSDVARRITSGGGDVDQLKVYRDMLGDKSKEYKGLLRSGVNEMMQDASFGSQYVDAGEFLSRLKGMSPEFRKEAIGPIEKELVGDAKVMELLQGKKVEPLEMERILNARPGKVSQTVREIVEDQKALDQQYSNALTRQLTDGRFNPQTLNPDEFMTRFVENASAQDLRQVMIQLRSADKELPEMIKKRAMLDLLNKTSGATMPEQVVEGGMGKFDFAKLTESLKGTTGEKYKTMLGAEAMDTLHDLSVIEAARAKAASLGKQSGQLVYSNILAALMDFKLSEIPRIAKNRVLAGMLTTPGLKQWLTSQAKIPATPAARFAVMSSPPVIRSILDEFSDEPDLAGQVIDAIKGSVDGPQKEKPPSASDLINAPASP